MAAEPHSTMICETLGFSVEQRVNEVVATDNETDPEMNDNSIEHARQMVASLRRQTKVQVFKQWSQACLGRVNNATVGEQRKAWMIYDIVRAKMGQTTADQVA